MTAAPRHRTIIGTSVEGRPIVALRHGTGPRCIHVIGVVHGNEGRGLEVVERIDALAKAGLEGCLARDASLLLVPCLNPDGLARGTRGNANGIDLNRNFPTGNQREVETEGECRGGAAASEPETRAVLDWMRDPALVFAIHQPLSAVNYDGPAQEVAEHLGELTRLPVQPDLGYPTPGSLGTYWGKEREKPVVTLELPREVPDSLVELMARAIVDSARLWCERQPGPAGRITPLPPTP